MAEQIVYITLIVDRKLFKVKKSLLIEYSDYFRAMFSGNFVEKEKDKIQIDVVDERSMEIIVRYMKLGMVDLSDFPLSIVEEVFKAATYLQITELTKQLNYCLEEQLSVSNWAEIRELAKKVPSPELEKVATNYGLLQFKNMKPEYIPTIEILFWYLSQPYLNTESELAVFTFGVKWCEWKEMNAEALLIILGTLDFSQLNTKDLEDMKYNMMMTDSELIFDYELSKARNVVIGLHNISKVADISISNVQKHKNLLCLEDEKVVPKKIYKLVINYLRSSVQRELALVPAVPVWTYEGPRNSAKAEVSENHLYTYMADGSFKEWIKITEKNHWGWNLTNWTPSKLVMCCGEYGRGTGKFMRDVKVYDTFKDEWVQHGVELPPRRHAGVIVLGDELYILGGVGEYRVLLDSAIVYDLKQKSFRKIAKLPYAIQSPAVCAHENEVYTIGQKNVYKYIGTGQNKGWQKVIDTDLTPNFMISYKGYIYMAQNYFGNLYRFQPGKDKNLKKFALFNYPPVAICNLGPKMIVFTSTGGDEDQETLTVEDFLDEAVPVSSEKIRWPQSVKNCGVQTTGACVVAIEPPARNNVVSAFHQHILKENSFEFLPLRQYVSVKKPRWEVSQAW